LLLCPLPDRPLLLARLLDEYDVAWFLVAGIFWSFACVERF
jgi:hypothetical protein